MLNIIGKLGFIFCLGLFFNATNVLGQSVGSGETCGINRLMVEDVMRLYNDSFRPEPHDSGYTYEMPVIIIARLGAKEKSTIYNVQRLKEIKGYFFKAGMPEGKIITAQGTRAKSKARVEVYFGGLLQFVIELKHKQNLQLLKCYY